MNAFLLLAEFFGFMIICLGLGESINKKDYWMIPIHLSIMIFLLLVMLYTWNDIQRLNKTRVVKKV